MISIRSDALQRSPAASTQHHRQHVDHHPEAAGVAIVQRIPISHSLRPPIGRDRSCVPERVPRSARIPHRCLGVSVHLHSSGTCVASRCRSNSIRIFGGSGFRHPHEFGVCDREPARRDFALSIRDRDSSARGAIGSDSEPAAENTPWNCSGRCTGRSGGWDGVRSIPCITYRVVACRFAFPGLTGSRILLLAVHVNSERGLARVCSQRHQNDAQGRRYDISFGSARRRQSLTGRDPTFHRHSFSKRGEGLARMQIRALIVSFILPGGATDTCPFLEVVTLPLQQTNTIVRPSAMTLGLNHSSNTVGKQFRNSDTHVCRD